MPDPRTPERRLPFDALAQYVGPVWGESVGHREMCGALLSPRRAVAIACNVSERTVVDWSRNGLTFTAAERVAKTLRCTPYDIWSADYERLEVFV